MKSLDPFGLLRIEPSYTTRHFPAIVTVGKVAKIRMPRSKHLHGKRMKFEVFSLMADAIWQNAQKHYVAFSAWTQVGIFG